MCRIPRTSAVVALHFLLWGLLCISLSACQSEVWASESELGLPLAEKDPSVPVRVLYIGNLCAGCAGTQLEQIAAGMQPPRIIKVDSVVIPKY